MHIHIQNTGSSPWIMAGVDAAVAWMRTATPMPPDRFSIRSRRRVLVHAFLR